MALLSSLSTKDWIARSEEQLSDRGEPQRAAASANAGVSAPLQDGHEVRTVEKSERRSKRGRRLILGQGKHERNVALCLSCLSESACLGYSKAALASLLLCKESKIRRRNLNKSAVVFGLAANAGDALGQAKYGFCLLHGTRIARNESEGARFCSLAADQGNRFGECLYGWCLHCGVGIPQDLKRSVHYYRRSAGHGDAGGRFSYACCLENGRGITINVRLAKISLGRKRVSVVAWRPGMELIGTIDKLRPTISLRRIRESPVVSCATLAV
jgi:TPR repeat protein